MTRSATPAAVAGRSTSSCRGSIAAAENSACIFRVAGSSVYPWPRRVVTRSTPTFDGGEQHHVVELVETSHCQRRCRGTTARPRRRTPSSKPPSDVRHRRQRRLQRMTTSFCCVRLGQATARWRRSTRNPKKASPSTGALRCTTRRRAAARRRLPRARRPRDDEQLRHAPSLPRGHATGSALSYFARTSFSCQGAGERTAGSPRSRSRPSWRSFSSRVGRLFTLGWCVGRRDADRHHASSRLRVAAGRSPRLLGA